jgi:hypothetical protein
LVRRSNEAVSVVGHSRDDWDKQGAAFCIELRQKMTTIFRRDQYNGYGARVKEWLK